MARKFVVTYGVRWTDGSGEKVLMGCTFANACDIANEVKRDGGSAVSVWQDSARSRAGRRLSAVKMHDV